MSIDGREKEGWGGVYWTDDAGDNAARSLARTLDTLRYREVFTYMVEGGTQRQDLDPKWTTQRFPPPTWARSKKIRCLVLGSRTCPDLAVDATFTPPTAIELELAVFLAVNEVTGLGG